VAGRQGQLAARDGDVLETAPEVRAGEVATADIATEVFFFPSSQVAEYDGSFTNTQRLLQWHYKAADPPGDCRSDMYFTYQLGKRLKALYADSTLPRDQGFNNLVWDYESSDPRERQLGEPESEKILKEINGYYSDDTRPPHRRPEDLKPTTARPVAPRGSTAACPRRRTRTARPTARPTRPVCAARTWAGALRGRPTAAFSTTASRPTRRAGRGASARSTSGGTRRRASGSAWTCPTSPPPSRPPTRPRRAPPAWTRTTGTDAFILKPDGVGWLYVPEGLVDGPLPTHYEPAESVVRNPLYKQQSSPVLKYWNVDGNPLAGWRTQVPARHHHLPADRALPVGRHEPLAPVAHRTAARAVRRAVARTGAREGHRQPRPRAHHQPARVGARQGAGDAAHAAAADRRAARCTRSACRSTGAGKA
jgi:formate dehydrogenase major subunit